MSGFNMAIANKQHFAKALYHRSLVKLRLADVRGATDDCNKAIAFNAGYADAYNKRGEIRAAAGDLAIAMQDFLTP